MNVLISEYDPSLKWSVKITKYCRHFETIPRKARKAQEITAVDDADHFVSEDKAKVAEEPKQSAPRPEPE